MQSKPQSIYELFDHKRRYIVPLFQRQYVWSQETQWEPLWEDIMSKAVARLERPSDDKVPPHFLGALVLNQVQTFGNAVPAYTIIDGQQRLTTFQIFLAAFRDVARAHESQYADETGRYIFNSGLMEKPDYERYKVFPTRADQAQFKDVLDCGQRSILEEKYPPIFKKRKLQARPRMVEAYLYFVSAIEEFLQESTDLNAEVDDLIEALYQALRRDLQVVSIELESQDDPQLIFETLNARGEPLLASDLLRNYLFRRAEQNNEDQDVLYSDYWVDFESDFWREEIRQGRLTRARIDIFMQHFLSLKTGDEINVMHLFQEYKKWIKESQPYPAIRDEIQDLLRYAKAFHTLTVPDLSTVLGRFAQRLEELDVRTIYPLMLFLMCDAELSSSEFEEILMDLESYLVRRMVCGKTTKNYNKMFLQILRELQLKGTSRDKIQDLLLSFVGDAGVFPDDREFRRAWIASPIYDRIKVSRVTSLLQSIELASLDKFSEHLTIGTKLTLEHVMPQDWETNWPIEDGVSKDVYSLFEVGTTHEELRDKLLHTFGNLTLLTQPLNSSVSNGAYEAKRPAITKQSLLRLNSYFQSVDHWNEEAIVRRGEELFEVAQRVWPYPR